MLILAVVCATSLFLFSCCKRAEDGSLIVTPVYDVKCYDWAGNKVLDGTFSDVVFWDSGSGYWRFFNKSSQCIGGTNATCVILLQNVRAPEEVKRINDPTEAISKNKSPY